MSQPAGSPTRSPSHDVVVVGAGFAGLACARRVAECGLSVLVLDRQRAPGTQIHTTGILVKEAWEEWRAPAGVVRRIERVRVYTPRHRSVEFGRDGYFFMATDTGGLMRHLVNETRRAGAEVRFGERFQGVAQGGDAGSGEGAAQGEGAESGEGAAPGGGAAPGKDAAPGGGAAPRGQPLSLNGSGASCRFLVGADGARSRVAESFGLDRNQRLLKGMEWEFERIAGADDCLHCFIDPECAPGYIGWVVPGVGMTQVGLAAHRHRRVDMRRFVAKIDGLFGLSGRAVLAKRGGVIPIGGLLRRFHRERVLLLGDAAGMVSPLTAGGIHNAYLYGRLAADAIVDHLDAGGPHPGAVLRRAYPRQPLKHAARWSFDHLPVAWALEAGLLGRNLFRRLAETVFFTGPGVARR